MSAAIHSRWLASDGEADTARIPTPIHAHLSREMAKFGKSLSCRAGWGARARDGYWDAYAYAGAIEIATVRRTEMDAALAALLGELFAIGDA